MTQTKIEGKFYPLKSEEWLKSIKELTHSELKILYYLRSIDPYSNGVSLSPAQIARDISTEKVKVHRSTVSRALKSLDRRGFISMELIKVRVKVISQGMLSENNGNVVTTQQCCDHATQVVPRQQTVQPHNTSCDQATNCAATQQLEAESIDISSFQNPKNIKTIKTNQTIQKAEGEKNFSQEVVAQQQIQNKESNEEKKLVSLSETLEEVSRDVVQDKTKIISPSKNSTTSNTSNNRSPNFFVERGVQGAEPRDPSGRKPAHSPSEVPDDLKEKLRELEIPLDSKVLDAIARHDILQAYGAAAHVEKTWETISNPRSVFLFQLPKQLVEKHRASNYKPPEQVAREQGITIDWLKKMYPHNWEEVAKHFGII
jgi:hypothetical protein